MLTHSPRFFTRPLLGFFALLLSCVAWAQNADTLDGDVGMAIYRTPRATRTPDGSNAVLPYVYADYGPFYARINTWGYKLMPLGTGHLEIATRVSLDGYRPTLAGAEDRANPRPVGVGTFQKTAYGAFFAYGFYDTTSGGHLLDLMYAARLRGGKLLLYPQLGIERSSARYVQHLYGINATQATNSGLPAYTGQSALSPYLGLTMQYPLGERYKLSYQIRQRWLGHAISDSPLVEARQTRSSFLAVTRSFN